MRLRLSRLLPLIAISLTTVLVGCRRELAPPEVENELLTPILKTKLNISKIVPDSLKSENSDGLISLVYRNTLYETGLDAFQELNTREFNVTAKLKELKLSNRTVENSVTLGQLYPSSTFLHGAQFPIPEIDSLSFGPEILDGSDYFDEMTLDSGYMDIIIHNGLPTSISNIEFEIKNQVNQNTVVDTSFLFVGSGASETRTINIASKSLESMLEASVTNFRVDSSGGPVLIDTTDDITVTVVIRDLKVYSAIAIFPSQNIIDDGGINPMDNVGDQRIIRAIAKRGFVNVEVESTIEDTLYFDYYIPEGRKDGLPFEVHETISPAPPGGSISKIYKYDVSGYEFGMTGFPVKDSFNVFYSQLIGRIDSTGRKVNITLDDSIRLFVSLSGFIPEYFEGYAGDTVINIGPESAPIDLFKKLNGGSLEFDQVKMAVGVSNGNNVPFDVKINSLSASNSKTGQSAAVDLGTIPNPISVQGASSVSVPWEMEWNFEDAQDNLNKVLSIFPDNFHSSMSVITNPAMNRSDLSQFAVDTNKLSAYADIEIPLSFIASNLNLLDTTEFNGHSIKKPEGIGSGTLYVIVNNSFPLTAEMELHFIAADGSIMQTVAFDKPAAAGKLNSPIESVLAWGFDRASFDKMLSSDRVIMKASVSTPPVGVPVKIYSTMELDVKLSARFNYSYGGK